MIKAIKPSCYCNNIINDMEYLRKKTELTLICIDNYLKSWSKLFHTAGGVARCQTYLFPMRSPGSHPPFRGFPLYISRKQSFNLMYTTRTKPWPSAAQGISGVGKGPNWIAND